MVQRSHEFASNYPTATWIQACPCNSDGLSSCAPTSAPTIPCDSGVALLERDFVIAEPATAGDDTMTEVKVPLIRDGADTAIPPLPWRKTDAYLKTLRGFFAMILGRVFRLWLWGFHAAGGWLNFKRF